MVTYILILHTTWSLQACRQGYYMYDTGTRRDQLSLLNFITTHARTHAYTHTYPRAPLPCTLAPFMSMDYDSAQKVKQQRQHQHKSQQHSIATKTFHSIPSKYTTHSTTLLMFGIVPRSIFRPSLFDMAFDDEVFGGRYSCDNGHDDAGDLICKHQQERLCPFREMERLMQRDPFNDPFFEDAFARRSETTGENEEVVQVPESEQSEEQKEEAGQWHPDRRFFSYKSTNLTRNGQTMQRTERRYLDDAGRDYKKETKYLNGTEWQHEQKKVDGRVVSSSESLIPPSKAMLKDGKSTDATAFHKQWNLATQSQSHTPPLMGEAASLAATPTARIQEPTE